LNFFLCICSSETPEDWVCKNPLVPNSSSIRLAFDGMSFAYHLYLFANKETPLWITGGDYAEFKASARSYIRSLRYGGVEPLVIFDGMQNPEKLSTKVERTQKQVDNVDILRRLAHSSSSLHEFQRQVNNDLVILPLFTVEALLQTLQEEAVVFYRAAGEADPLLARYCQDGFCKGVVSNDTDFMVLDLGDSAFGWIPFQYLHFSTEMNHVGNGAASNYRTNVTCRMFRRSALASALRLPEELMPVVASLCGNDLVDSQAILYKRLEHYSEKMGRRRSGKRKLHVIQLAAQVVRDHIQTRTDSVGARAQWEALGCSMLGDGLERVTEDATYFEMTVETNAPLLPLVSTQKRSKTDKIKKMELVSKMHTLITAICHSLFPEPMQIRKNELHKKKKKRGHALSAKEGLHGTLPIFLRTRTFGKNSLSLLCF
jgi:hypothetical protein